MPAPREFVLPLRPLHHDLRSLVWDGDDLVDHAAGGERYALDGSGRGAPPASSHPFDAAIVSPSGELVLLYERLGTNALLVRAADHGVVRTIPRDAYGANAFLFPAAFVRLPDGRDGLAHCPRRYDTLEIEDAATGQSLTRDGRRDRTHAVPEYVPEYDVFHSQLVASPDGAWLASAGWAWHPLGVARCWRIADVLREPIRLDGEALEMSPTRGLIHADGVAFVDERTLAVATHEDHGRGADCVRLVDLASGETRGIVPLATPMGATHAWRGHGVLALHEHVRCIDPRSGELLHAWPHLRAGRQRGAIVTAAHLPPPFAVHATRPWFAIGGDEGITVVQLE